MVRDGVDNMATPQLRETFSKYVGQLQQVKTHELTHRAQLFMYLLLKGIVPPTTRRRMAKAKP